MLTRSKSLCSLQQSSAITKIVSVHIQFCICTQFHCINSWMKQLKNKSVYNQIQHVKTEPGRDYILLKSITLLVKRAWTPLWRQDQERVKVKRSPSRIKSSKPLPKIALMGAKMLMANSDGEFSKKALRLKKHGLPVTAIRARRGNKYRCKKCQIVKN